VQLLHKTIAPLDTLKTLLRKGGLKLKLVGFTVLLIVTTVIAISSITIDLMTGVLEKKAIEVATSSIERIADFSSHALLERSYENQLNLEEMITQMRQEGIEGFLDISIYAKTKEQNLSTFIYQAGFGQYSEGALLEDARLVEKLNAITSDTLFFDSVVYTQDEKQYQAYRFVRPILYMFQNRPIVLGVAILHYDKAAISGVIERIISVSTWIAVGVVVLSMILVYFAGTRFTRPILTIANAATQVSNGNLHIDLNIHTNDEIEELALRFNRMVEGLREREKMQKFVSSSTMSMIQEDSKRQLSLGGQYQTLTFLFTDIRGFTAMSETKRPQEVVEIINFYLDMQSQIIKEYGGDIDKYVGDEIMASFAGEEGVERAVSAAVTIQKQILHHNQLRKAKGATTCEVGIGINHGEVIVGNIGSQDRMDFTSIGSVVNLAARLCANANKGQILIEEKTYEMAHTTFEAQPEAPINVKGFSKPVPIISITPKEA